MHKTFSTFLVIATLLIGYNVCGQEFSFSMNDTTQAPHEIGIDGHFGASNFGGAFGLGLKYGITKKQDPQWVFGPSFRIQRTWSNLLGQANGFNVIGFGGFAHARFYQFLYLGAEFELLNSPIRYDLINPPKSWVPTLFLGGGYSHKFDAGWRFNVGLYYDIIDNLNSPFRGSYIAKKEVNGQVALIPVIYRVALFIPLR